MMDPELFDYLIQIVPAAEANCVGCDKLVEVGAAIRRDDKFFCTEGCADRALAILVRPQPKNGFKIEGWDL